jgi:hypothetical protein
MSAKRLVRSLEFIKSVEFGIHREGVRDAQPLFHFMYLEDAQLWYLSSDIIYSSEIYVRATFYCTMIYFLWSVVSLSQETSWCCPPPAVGISTEAPRRPS